MVAELRFDICESSADTVRIYPTNRIANSFIQAFVQVAKASYVLIENVSSDLT